MGFQNSQWLKMAYDNFLSLFSLPTLHQSSLSYTTNRPMRPYMIVWIVPCPFAFSLSHQAPDPSLSCSIYRPRGPSLMRRELALELKGQSDPSWHGKSQQLRARGLSNSPWQGRLQSAIEKTTARKGVLTSQSFRPNVPIFPEETAIPITCSACYTFLFLFVKKCTMQSAALPLI